MFLMISNHYNIDWEDVQGTESVTAYVEDLSALIGGN